MAFALSDLRLLALIGMANLAPIIAWRLMGSRCARPVDGGWKLADGQALFGESKTIRGLVAALLATPISACLLGFDFRQGIVVGMGAMAGDLFSSFIKRRMKMPASSMALLLDQVPESLFPLLLLRNELGLDWLRIASLVIAFVITELALSRLLFRLKLRKRPY